MRRLNEVAFAIGVFGLALAGCGQGDQAQERRQEPPEQATQTGQPAATEQTQTAADEPTVTQGEQTMRGATGGGDEVMVGGFPVEGPSGETTVPQVSAEQEAVREYLDQVQPIFEDSPRDISDLVHPEVRLENGQLRLVVGFDSLRQAREETRRGLERLRDVQPPEDLEPIHERLIAAYEEVLPAYENVVEAAESGNPDRAREMLQQSLPRIEQFNEVTTGILQDLERAAGTS